jgi:hypothetical protein
LLRCPGRTYRKALWACNHATICRAPGALNQAARAPAPVYAAPARAAYVPPPAPPVAARPIRREGVFDSFLGTGGPARAPQTTVAQFGSESIANNGAHANPTARDNDTIAQISARVIAYDFANGYVTVTLDNGQVWRQTPSGAALGHLSRPPLSYTAVISRDGPYGSYGLKLSGVAQVIGVRRIR